jgi:sigma-B regulation protein RsbU (phosphoserine phosphatase)
MAQILDIEEMFKAIGGAFLARFPLAQLSICQKSKSGFTSVHASGLLDTPDARKLSELAMAPFLKQDAEMQFLDNWPENPRLKFDWPVELAQYPCWIAVPLQADNTTLAVVQIFAPLRMKTTFQQEKTLLSTLAAHAAACLSNAIHYKYLEVKARMEGELEAARNIQQSLTPQDTPLIPRVNIAGVYLPAHEVGGDYLDYFQCGDGSWVVFVADVCGKGVPAALLMVVLRSIARVESRSNFSARSLLCAVNQSMMLNINERSFITALCLVIKADGSSMTYARSGHPKLLKMDAAGVVSTINSNGIALGMMADPSGYSSIIQEVFIPLVAGDTYLAYTDGLSEATDSKMTAFDLPYITRSMRSGKDKPAKDLVAGILEDVKKFTDEKSAHDDLTLFAMKVTG